jgi:Tfp pilus assembly PilM family ATPase
MTPGSTTTLSSLFTERILCVDVGSRYVKIAGAVRTPRTLEPGDRASFLIAEDASPEDIAGIVAKIARERNLTADRFILGLGGRSAFFRQISFPFSKREKVAQALPFELAPLVPVNMEEMVVDFISLGGTPGHVLAAVLPRELLGRWIQAFESNGLPPDVVGLSPAGPALLAGHFPQPMPANFLTVDIGWRSTSVLYLAAGEILELRTIPLGLMDVVKPHMEPGEDPDQLLSRLDLNPIRSGEEGEPFTKTREAVAAIGREIGMTGFALHAKHPEVRWEQALLCGGGTLVKGLPAAMELHLQMPVRLIQEAGSGLLGREADSGIFAAALGLGLHGVDGRQGFNYRKNGFASVRHRGYKEFLLPAAVSVAAILLSWTISLGVTAAVEHKQLASLERQVQNTFSQAVPDLQTAVRPAQYESVLRSRIQALGGGSVQAGQPIQPAIDTLLGISQALSGDLKLTIQDLVIDHESIRMSGTAEAFNTVEEAKNRLTKVQGIQDVRIRGAKADAGGKTISFSLQLLRHGGSPS